MQCLGAMKLFLQVLQYPLMCWFCLNKCQDARTWVFTWIFCIWRLLSRWSCHEALQAPSLTSSPSHHLGFARMMVCSSLEVSRTESKRLEEANVLPNSAITAIIAAAVPWLQTLKQRFCVTPGLKTFTRGRCFKVTLSCKGCPNCMSKSWKLFLLFFSWASTSWRSFFP